jgi:hypothetical protein
MLQPAETFSTTNLYNRQTIILQSSWGVPPRQIRFLAQWAQPNDIGEVG